MMSAMSRWIAVTAVSCVALGCVTGRGAPRGLQSDGDQVAEAERLVKKAANVREIGAGLSGVAAGVGALLLIGTQAQPTPSPADSSFGNVPVQSEVVRQRILQVKENDRTYGVATIVGALGVFLGACLVSAGIDAGSSEWLLEQRSLEVEQLTVPENEANRRLFEAAKEAQKLPAPSGTTIRPTDRKRPRRERVPVLSPVPNG